MNNLDDFGKQLRESVRKAYSSVAENPMGKHAFPVGRRIAIDLGYPIDTLDNLPNTAIDCFAGVSNVSIYAAIEKGDTVLDLGCGCGLDILIAAEKTGSKGKVIGIDFSEEMIKTAEGAVRQSGQSRYNNISLHRADAEGIPLPDGSIDAALVNGIFNLNPLREKIFLELARVVKKGGRVYASELILKDPSLTSTLCSFDNWVR